MNIRKILSRRSVGSNLLIDRRAVTAIEYALIASLIAVAIIAALSLLGNSISGQFNFVSQNL